MLPLYWHLHFFVNLHIVLWRFKYELSFFILKVSFVIEFVKHSVTDM